MINSSDNTNGYKMCPTCLPDLSHLKELIRISDKKKVRNSFQKWHPNQLLDIVHTLCGPMKKKTIIKFALKPDSYQAPKKRIENILKENQIIKDSN